ncbi:MAG: MOSC domain-containing protein [Cyclobacteriaceae bacterium]|nr:MOSC domain-containing protein [Cyclobacteriaceae bacterium]
MILKELYVYPVKSLAGINLNAALAGERGLLHDRRFMLIDENGLFISQREHASMALFAVEQLQDQLKIFHRQKTEDCVFVKSEYYEGEATEVQIWDDQCKAIIMPASVNDWFSDKLKMNCRMVYMPEDSIRLADPDYVPETNKVSFADAFPYLLVTSASLHQVSEKAGQTMDVSRFRPNLVIDNDIPFEEDSWKKIAIGECVFRIVKPCARCVVTTIDQQTSKKGKEPLQSMAGYRKKGNKILFGQNLIAENYGWISIGDKIEILETL